MDTRTLLVGAGSTLRTALEEEGYDVVTARAADATVEHAVDCVVAFGGADATGLERAAAIRERDPLCPVVVVDDEPLAAVAEEALEVGIAAYVRRNGDVERALPDAIDEAATTYRRRRDRTRLPRDGPDPGVVVRGGTITVASPGAAELLGAESVEGCALATLVGEASREAVTATVEAVGAETRSVRFVPEDAPDRTVEARLTRTPDDAVVATLVDVTARAARVADLERDSEMLDSLLENAPISIYFKDRRCRFERASGHMLRTDPADRLENDEGKAHPHPADVVGKTNFDLYDPEFAEKATADDQQVMADEEPIVGEIEAATTSGGETRYLSTTKAPRYDEDGTVVGLVGVSVDVTDRIENREELEHQNQRLNEFAEVLTHDLRNPLNIAQGYLDVLRMDPDGEAIEECEAALDRIESLIEEVQTSVLQNRNDPDPAPVDLETAAREAWSTVDTGAATFEIDGEMRLRADPGRFRRLLENLFRNSIEHGADDAGERGAGFTVRVVAREDGFAVEDDGLGLPTDVEDDLFERGFTTNRDGTGFGLAIVRNIAENHGWEVSAGESAAGGACFAFSQVLGPDEAVVEMDAGGDDIWADADQGNFYYEEVTGDFDVAVEVRSVANTHAWAKGGLMVRPSSDAGAAHAMLRRRPNGRSTLQWRPVADFDARSLTSIAGRPEKERDVGEPEHDWHRLVREGETLRCYTSETGDDGDWQLLAELSESELDLPETVLVGIAATSHNRAEPTTVRFANLSGIDPEEAVDIGEPIMSGSVRTIQPALVAADEPEDVTATGATLRGSVESMQASDELAVHFEYREVMAEEWIETDARSVAGTGDVDVRVTDLSPRRYYEYRVVADYGDGEIERSPMALVATPGESTGADEPGPPSSAHFDPADGFADVAPWLDDDTPIVRITEPDREQLERAASVDGPRVVVFETSGTIDLDERDVTVTGDRCWLAGQTAPSPGITLIRGRLKVSADGCVIQHLRSRPGDADLGVDDDFEKEAILVADGVENTVVDHCTATWSPVENGTVSYRTHNTTVTNCLIAEGLYDAADSKGFRGYGALIGDGADRVALLGNVWAHNRGRNPWLQLETEAALVNNVHFDADEAVILDGPTVATVEGNVFRGIDADAPVTGGRAYVADNRVDDGPTTAGVEELPERPVWPAGLEPMASDETLERALEHAGARPADRTRHDERVIERLREGTRGWIDSQADVGGYPDLAENYEPVTAPVRNLRAWLRERARDVEP